MKDENVFISNNGVKMNKIKYFHEKKSIGRFNGLSIVLKPYEHMNTDIILNVSPYINCVKSFDCFKIS